MKEGERSPFSTLFGQEVVKWPLPAGVPLITFNATSKERPSASHFKADEASYVGVVLFQQLTNRFARFHNERLTGQRNFAGEFLHAAFNHFLCDFFRLTRLHRDVQLYLVFFLYHFSRHVFRLNELRLACSNVHCQLFNQLFVSAFSRNQNTDARTVLVQS